MKMVNDVVVFTIQFLLFTLPTNRSHSNSLFFLNFIRATKFLELLLGRILLLRTGLVLEEMSSEASFQLIESLEYSSLLFSSVRFKLQVNSSHFI